jgi:tricorn protease
MDATPQGVNSKKPVSTAGLTTEINPAEEWNQIFGEVWRRYRDWFYVANMHGYDWAKLREQYKSWLPFVAHRSDLNYVISEMISELRFSTLISKAAILTRRREPSRAAGREI